MSGIAGIQREKDTALVGSMLEAMGRDEGRDRRGFFSTHPRPADRLARVRREIASAGGSAPVDPARTRRAARYLARLR